MLKYGFFDSIKGDRKYNSKDVAELFDGIIVDGIYAQIGERFSVDPKRVIETEEDKMTVTVGTGQAWLSHTKILNTSKLELQLSEGIGVNRYDAIIVEVNDNKRSADIFVKPNVQTKTENAATAFDLVSGQLINTEFIHQYLLAVILVEGGATKIKADNIASKIGFAIPDGIPYVTCPLEPFPADETLKQWVAQWATFFGNSNSAFNAAQTQRAALFDSAQQERATAFNDAQTQRATDFNTDQTERNTDYQTLRTSIVDWLNSTETDWNTWYNSVRQSVLNSKDNDGLVSAGNGNLNKFWMTDPNGNPGWRNIFASSIANIDLNTVVTPGLYYVQNRNFSGNTPNNTSLCYGWLQVDSIFEYHWAVRQVLYIFDDRTFWHRVSGNTGSTWSVWETLGGSNGNSSNVALNTKNTDGIVKASGENFNGVWWADENGNPGWRRLGIPMSTLLANLSLTGVATLSSFFSALPSGLYFGTYIKNALTDNPNGVAAYCNYFAFKSGHNFGRLFLMSTVDPSQMYVGNYDGTWSDFSNRFSTNNVLLINNGGTGATSEKMGFFNLLKGVATSANAKYTDIQDDVLVPVSDQDPTAFGQIGARTFLSIWQYIRSKIVGETGSKYFPRYMYNLSNQNFCMSTQTAVTSIFVNAGYGSLVIAAGMKLLFIKSVSKTDETNNCAGVYLLFAPTDINDDGDTTPSIITLGEKGTTLSFYNFTTTTNTVKVNNKSGAYTVGYVYTVQFADA